MSSISETTDGYTPLNPKEGWHVIHLFYKIEYSQWDILSRDEQRESMTYLTQLVQEIRSHPDTQLLTFAIATPKADLGFVLLTPDLNDAVSFEKRLSLSLGAEILSPIYSYLSLTERSEYPTTAEQYAKELTEEKKLTEGSDEFNDAMKEFDERIAHYTSYRVYPKLPDWPIICFYPMSKRRLNNDNWYSLDFDTRAKLMKSHATTGRKYKGRILQMITGSTGLDEQEWGVTLLGKSSSDIKDIVYEMRFDEVSARYAEFGDFYIGTQLPLGDLFRQLCLTPES